MDSLKVQRSPPCLSLLTPRLFCSALPCLSSVMVKQQLLLFLFCPLVSRLLPSSSSSSSRFTGEGKSRLRFAFQCFFARIDISRCFPFTPPRLLIV
jgi:hypothetical protein